MEGYRQSEKYFVGCKDIIAGELRLPTPTEPNFLAMGRIIESCDGVAAGLRVFEEVPGDNKTGVGWVVPLSFYEKAAHHLTDKVNMPTFF